MHAPGMSISGTSPWFAPASMTSTWMSRFSVRLGGQKSACCAIWERESPRTERRARAPQCPRRRSHSRASRSRAVRTPQSASCAWGTVWRVLSVLYPNGTSVPVGLCAVGPGRCLLSALRARAPIASCEKQKRVGVGRTIRAALPRSRCIPGRRSDPAEGGVRWVILGRRRSVWGWASRG